MENREHIKKNILQKWQGCMDMLLFQVLRGGQVDMILKGLLNIFFTELA